MRPVGDGDGAAAIFKDGRHRLGGVLSRQNEVVFRLPHLEQHDQRSYGRQRRQDIGQFGSHKVRNEELRAGEGKAAQQGGRSHAFERGPSAHDQDQVSRDDQRDRRADAADPRAEPVQRQFGDGLQRDQRRADRPERHRSRISKQTDAGGVKRREAESGEHGGGYGHRRAESGCALDEGAEREGDEQGLQTPVLRQIPDRVFQCLELAHLHGDAVEQDGGEHDPSDGEQTVGHAVDDGAEQLVGRHAIGEGGHQCRGGQAGQRGDPRRLAFHAQKEQQDEDRNGGGDRRKAGCRRWECNFDSTW